jgi:hypothetical protein
MGLLYLYYTVKLNGSLVSVCNNANGYQHYANMKHNLVWFLTRQKISSNVGGENRLNPMHREIPLLLSALFGVTKLSNYVPHKMTFIFQKSI